MYAREVAGMRGVVVQERPDDYSNLRLWNNRRVAELNDRQIRCLVAAHFPDIHVEIGRLRTNCILVADIVLVLSERDQRPLHLYVPDVDVRRQPVSAHREGTWVVSGAATQRRGQPAWVGARRFS